MKRSIPEKLLFFQQEFVSDIVESSFLEAHHPVGFSVTNQSNPVRFFIRGSEMWLDLEKSYFYIEGTVNGTDLNTGGTPCPPSTSPHLTLINNFLHSLFSSIHVSVNESPVTFNNDNYPYLSYIQRLFNQPGDFQKETSDLYLWKKDTPGSMNGKGRKSKSNSGAVARDEWLLTPTKNKVKGIMKLHSPLMMINKYLLSFLDLDITMNRTENPEFFFMSEAGSSFSFRLDSIIFYVRKVKLVSDYIVGVEKMMHSGGESIMYPLKDSRVFTKTYSGYGAEIIEDNLFHGVLPSRIVIGLVSNEAYKGTWEENPYNFRHFDMVEIGLTLNGRNHPYPMTPMDFTKEDTHRIYHHMLESMQGANPNPSQGAVAISKKEFDNGYTLFSFDMSPDQYGGMNHQSLFNQPANIRLQLRFKQGNATALITLIVYYELSSRMMVNASRQVTIFAK